MIDQTSTTNTDAESALGGVSRRAFLAFTALAAGAATLPAWARAARQPAEMILEWEEFAPGVFAQVNTNTGGNVLVAAGRGRTLVIDSKYPYIAEAIRRDALGMGEPDADVMLVNTHHHGDHTGGNPAFVGRAETMAHENALPRIEAQYETYMTWVPTAVRQARQSVPGNDKVRELAEEFLQTADGLTAKSWLPERGVGREDRLNLGGMAAELRHFGAGHTDNDLVVRIPELNVVHTGDLVFNSFVPFFDADAGVTAFGWIASLREIEKLCDDETIVVPGHGRVGDKQVVVSQIAFLEKLVEAVQAEIDAGVPKDQARIKQFEFMNGLGFKNLGARAIDAVYDELVNSAG
ncbi:MAG: MBL fold metallo-hydrolase [Phycisphaerales bacterium]